jgi:hypothetical protein
MLAPDAPLRERILWAVLSVIVGLAHDGPEVATERRCFSRMEAVAASFGIGTEDFDALAKRMNFHYYRPWDCYLGRKEWTERTLSDALPIGAFH